MQTINEVKSISLFEIQEEHERLFQRLEELMELQEQKPSAEEDADSRKFDPEELACVMEELNLTEETFEAKAKNYFYALKMYAIQEKTAIATASAIEAEAKRYKNVAKRKKQMQENLKRKLNEAMGVMGKKEVKFEDGSAITRVFKENSGVDVSKMKWIEGVNDEFFTLVPTPNKKLIKKHLLNMDKEDAEDFTDSKEKLKGALLTSVSYVLLSK